MSCDPIIVVGITANEAKRYADKHIKACTRAPICTGTDGNEFESNLIGMRHYCVILLPGVVIHPETEAIYLNGRNTVIRLGN